MFDENTSSPDPNRTDFEDNMWNMINVAPMPLWIAMIVAPKSKITQRIMDKSGYWFAGLSVAYVLQLVNTMVNSERTSMDLDSMMKGMSSPLGFLTGWTHFIAFDLFVGRWIWQRGLVENRSTRIALFLTLMAGPAGLGVYGVQRGSLSLDPQPR